MGYKMNRLIIPLNRYQQDALLEFFLINPGILAVEHYLHTHSPLDNLEHYMWEELHEPNHKSIRRRYEENRSISNADIDTWIEQELEEREES